MANAAEVTEAKSTLVGSTVQISTYVDQVSDVEMTEIPASQQANTIADKEPNNPFANWVHYNNISDENNVLINKFIPNTINIIDSSTIIHVTLYYFCLSNI